MLSYPWLMTNFSATTPLLCKSPARSLQAALGEELFVLSPAQAPINPRIICSQNCTSLPKSLKPAWVQERLFDRLIFSSYVSYSPCPYQLWDCHSSLRGTGTPGRVCNRDTKELSLSAQFCQIKSTRTVLSILLMLAHSFKLTQLYVSKAGF